MAGQNSTSSVPQSFKAAVFAEKGSTASIVERSLDAPLEAGEVEIKITASAINPVDWKIRDTGFFINTWPAVLGSDAAGVVAAVAPDVAHLVAGDRVFFQGIIGRQDYSTFQHFCKMPAALVGKTPSNISDAEAAGVSLATVAAVTGFYSESGRGLPAPWSEAGDQVGKGRAIVIIGGASSVGQYAIQLARLSGYERIITNASVAHHAFLTQLGAHVVLDRKSTGVEDFKTAIGADLPLDFVFDSIANKETQLLGVQITQAAKEVVTAKVVIVQGPDAEAVRLGEQEPNVNIAPVMGVGSSPALRHLSEPLMAALGGERGWLAKGLFRSNRPHVVPGGLSALDEALGLNKKGVSGEKVVISMSES